MGRVTHYDTQRMMAYLLSQRENVAKYWVTVTAGQTHVISRLGVSAATVVDWGDGLSNEYTGTATRTHVYASAGTYEVDIYTPENVTSIGFAGASNIELNTRDIANMVNITSFDLENVPNVAGVFDTEEIKQWQKLTDLYVYNAGLLLKTINTSDLPTTMASLTLHGYSGWVGLTIPPASIKNWSSLTYMYLNTRTITQPLADLILWECYQIQRTVTGGKILLSFAGNAAPSGTFQACQSPPVSASTPGKEIAYELLNDSLGVGFNKWATVNTN